MYDDEWSGSLPGVLSHVVALYLQRCLWCLRLQDEMVVAVRAVLVAAPHQSERYVRQSLLYSRVLELARIFPKGLFALFAYEDHVKGLHERMVALFLVTFCAVEPFFACPISQHSAMFWLVGGGGDVQHGERMETWALRMCLLGARELGCGGDCGGVGSSACLPHGGVVVVVVVVVDGERARYTTMGGRVQGDGCRLLVGRFWRLVCNSPGA